MNPFDGAFAGSIPEVYDRLMVPLIFRFYAEDLANRVAALSPRAVLETAAGSGAVTRALARRLGPEARYAVTDLSPFMLNIAMSRQDRDDRISWQSADATDLPFDDGSFDVVCCQFGVMFFPDRIAAYQEALRVLRPGGHFLFSAWDQLEKNEYANFVSNELALIFSDNPPSFIAQTPHAYHDADLIQQEVSQAGFSVSEITTVEAMSYADTPLAVATAFCQGTPLRNEIEARDQQGLERVIRLTAQSLAVRYGSGSSSARLSAHVCDAVV